MKSKSGGVAESSFLANEVLLARKNVDDIASRLAADGFSPIRLDARFPQDQCATAFAKNAVALFASCDPIDAAIYRIFKEINTDAKMNRREILEIVNDVNALVCGVKFVVTRVGDVWVVSEQLHGSAESFLRSFYDGIEECVRASNEFLARC